MALCRTAAHRIASAVVTEEIRRLRDTNVLSQLPPYWPEAMPIGEEGLGLDSLEQLGALGALAETFNLDDALLSEVAPCTVGAWLDWIMRQQGSGGGCLVVRTSGSTGHPTLCVHAVAELIGEAQLLATQFSERRRVVALVPAHHLYGIIWTALLPTVLRIPVVARTIGAPLDLAPGDLVVAVPSQWQAIERLTRTFPNDVVGISSASPLNDDLAAGLLAAGLSRLLDIYGSSETSGIAIRVLPATAYKLLPRWRLVTNEDSDWELEDGYGRRHELPDHVERVTKSELRLVGRRDGAVQIGGQNVWPNRVADMLRQLDGVAEVAVRLHSNGRLKAFIVPANLDDPDELAARVEKECADRFSWFERPKSWRFGAALPRNQMGKLEDWV